jgi:hypothetical protein
MNKRSNDIQFFIPNLKKSIDEDGNMYLEGIASTKDEDLESEVLDPRGFDLSYFKKQGTVNWNHQSKNNPNAIIGEPYIAKINSKGELFVKVKLYKDNPLAKATYETALMLEKNSDKRKLGFSIEGKRVEKTTNGGKTNTPKAMITGLAITHTPINFNTYAEVCKALQTDNNLGDSGTRVNNVLIQSNFTKKNRNMSNSKLMKTCKGYMNSGMDKEDIMNKMLEDGYDTDEIEEAYDACYSTMNKGVGNKKSMKAETEDNDYDDDDSDDDYDDDEDSDDDDMPKMPLKKGAVKKSIDKQVFDFKKFEKSLADKMDATATILQGILQKQREVIEKVDNLEQQIEVVKGFGENTMFEEQFSEITKGIESLQQDFEDLKTPIQKSVTVSRERNFEKSVANTQQAQRKNKKEVLNKLEELSFEKGLDPFWSSVMTTFESTGNLSESAKQRLKSEHNFTY